MNQKFFLDNQHSSIAGIYVDTSLRHLSSRVNAVVSTEELGLRCLYVNGVLTIHRLNI